MIWNTDRYQTKNNIAWNVLLMTAGKSVCAVVTFVNWNWFKEWESLAAATTKDHVYSELKNGIQDQIKKVVLKNFPQLKTKVVLFYSE